MSVLSLENRYYRLVSSRVEGDSGVFLVELLPHGVAGTFSVYGFPSGLSGSRGCCQPSSGRSGSFCVGYHPCRRTYIP